MNAVISLCHFCELHGPSVVFCTQAFHEDEDPDHILQCTRSTGQQAAVPDIDQKPCYGGLIKYLRSSSTSSNEDEGSSIPKTKVSDTCDACRSIPTGRFGYISNDHESKVSYVGSQYPCHPEVFSAVRQACVQSLSCEVCVGREGPIFFGDDVHGYVFSYTFFLKDSQARGLQRWYSVVVLMTDKVFLLSSWPFLVKHIRTIIDDLQDKTNKLFESEQSECSQRALRLNSVMSLTPGDFRRQRGANKAMRSLPELTGDPLVFESLHSTFTWILLAGANRLVEKTLEGNLTEDTVIDLEKQEETEEGFMMINTKKVPVEYQKEGSQGEVHIGGGGDDSDIGWLNIRHIAKLLGPDQFPLLAYHVITGDQVIVRCAHKCLTKAIIQSLQILIPRGCFRPIYYSLHYQESYKYNFVGLPLDVVLPAHVTSSALHVQLVIDCQPGPVHSNPDALSDVTANLISVATLPERLPTVLVDMQRAIDNPNLSENVLGHYFVSLKEEWMNKVKVVFKFARSGSRSVADTQSLLTVLGALDCDKQVLKFWMTGLSTLYKTYVLSAPMSQCLGNEGVT